MTFLQPWILWGLPLVLLPVLIHLFNRLRHRSLPWAAMMFLRTATRKSSRYARLRQFLILLFRVLAVAGLVFAVSRPLAGGWLGWAMSAAPDAILVLLDRSASMEGKAATGAQPSKREEAVALIAESAQAFERGSRVVLVENVLRAPEEVPPAALADLPLTAATDTATDIPALLQTALDWLVATRPGTVEIWLASDLQGSNWDPESERWPALVAGWSGLPQGVRFRLLGLTRDLGGNHAVTVEMAEVSTQGGRRELELVLDLERNSANAAVVPLNIVINGVSAQVDVKWESQSLRYRHRVPLTGESGPGWGYAELPADVNLRDNRSYFVYGVQPALRAVVVGREDRGGRFLQLATAPNSEDTNQTCRLISPTDVPALNWSELAMILWQEPMPTGQTAAALEAFVADGGVAVFFPPGQPGSFQGLGWGAVEEAADEETFSVAHWDEEDGPLAKTDEGLNLPLAELEVRRRQIILGEAEVLGVFRDEKPFLVRHALGKGQMLFCGTAPEANWSGLGEGPVLVPMLQRLLREGGRRFSGRVALDCGDSAALRGEERWLTLDSSEPKDPLTQAGVYRSGPRLLAVNRPAREDDPTVLEPDRVKALFGDLSLRLFEERGTRASRLQSELWRLFLLAMAAFLLVEAVLILPERPGPVGLAAVLARGEEGRGTRDEGRAVSGRAA